MEKQKEKKNIYGHISDLFQGDGQKKKKSFFDFNAIKKLIISFGVYAIIGFLIGTICDILLGLNYLGLVLSLGFMVIWFIRKLKNYL